MNFTELDSSQMKQVHGGDWLGDLQKVVDSAVNGVTGLLGLNPSPPANP